MSVATSPALLVPWYWRGVQWLQSVIDTRPKQYVATVALPLAFFATVFVIYLGGVPLKRRFADELVEIARTLTIMFVALVDAILFVIIWRWFGETTTELDAFGSRLVPTAQTAVNLYIAFIALLGTYMLTRVTKRIIRYWSKNERISPHQRELAHHLTQISLFLVVVVFIFGLFGLQATDLFLGAGALGIVLGLAARQTLANVLSGLIILFGRPFEAGDWIKVGEQEGIVTDINVLNTQVRTFNEEHLLIPNDEVTNQEVINYSKTERLRLTTDVGIDYDDDISKAATIAKRTMQSCETVANSPNPDVILEAFGDSEVVLRLRYWIDRPTIQQKLSAQNEVIEAVKAAFEEADVKIPFPQRELLGREETDGLQVTQSEEVVPTDDERIQRAVRAVSDADTGGATAVSEPVEEKYAGDGEAADAEQAPDEEQPPDDEQAPDDEQPPDDERPADDEQPPDDEQAPDDEQPGDEAARSGPPDEEPVDDEHAGDGHPETGEDDVFEDVESAAHLVEDDDADLSSPHPRDQDVDVYPNPTDEDVREPVEEYGRRGTDGESDEAATETPSEEDEDIEDASAGSGGSEE